MMKSRKEKTTRKRGLTSEEYIDILNESKPDKNEWKELLKIAMETRKFEIELYWKRANYFWLFVAAFFVAYYQTIPSENKQTEVENILFIVGDISSLLAGILPIEAVSIGKKTGKSI